MVMIHGCVYNIFLSSPITNSLMPYVLLQYVGLQNLIQRNKQLYGSGNTPTGGVALPFILVQVELSDVLQRFSCLRFTIKTTETGVRVIVVFIGFVHAFKHYY